MYLHVIKYKSYYDVKIRSEYNRITLVQKQELIFNMRFVQRTRDEMRRCYTRTYSRTIFILCFIGTCIVIMFEHITLTGRGSPRKSDSNMELNKCECPFSPGGYY